MILLTRMPIAHKLEGNVLSLMKNNYLQRTGSNE